MENSCKTLRYLTTEIILEVAESYVGSDPLMQENQLRYLVEIVGQKYGEIELYPTLTEKAAVYAHHIITGHIFWDGNKRTGMTCALQFLELNGCSLRLGIDDLIVELGLKIADGTITDIDIIAEHLQSWLEPQIEVSGTSEAK